MDRKIIVDSCTDINDDIKDYFETVPLKIIIDNEEIIDRDLDTDQLLDKIKGSQTLKTACPSPGEYYEAFIRNKENFVVTLSSKLSGSYSSAVTACEMIKENSVDSFVHVFDSRSAASAQSMISIKIKELMDLNHTKEEIVSMTSSYVEKLRTLFILESYDHLLKAGRLSKVKASLATFLQISPIMGANKEGEIIALDKVRGRKKAFSRLVDMIGEEEVDFENTILGITHVKAPQRAQKLKEDILRKYPFKDVMIFEARGISTVYADDGGIVVSY